MSAPLPYAPNAWTPAEIETLTELRTVKGWSAGAIAQVLAPRTIRGVERKMGALGLKLPGGKRLGKYNRRSNRVDAVMREAFFAGCGIKETAKAIGICGKAVRAAFEDLGAEYAASQAAFVAQGNYIGAREMAAIVAPICGVPPRAILSQTRYRPAVIARMAIARALRDRNTSKTVIAKALNRKDHTTIIWSLRNFDRYAHLYPNLIEAYEAIKSAEAVAAERMAA